MTQSSEREELGHRVRDIRSMYDDHETEANFAIVDMFLTREKEIWIKAFIAGGTSGNVEQVIRLSERIKVAEDLKKEWFGDMRGCLYTTDGLMVKRTLDKIITTARAELTGKGEG